MADKHVNACDKFSVKDLEGKIDKTRAIYLLYLQPPAMHVMTQCAGLT